MYLSIYKSVEAVITWETHTGSRKTHAARFPMWSLHKPSLLLYHLLSIPLTSSLQLCTPTMYTHRPPPVFTLTLHHLSAPGAYFSEDESMATPLIAQFITWIPRDNYRKGVEGNKNAFASLNLNISPSANAELNFLCACSPAAVSR